MMNAGTVVVKKSDLDFALEIMDKIRNGALIENGDGSISSPVVNVIEHKDLQVKIRSILTRLGVRANIKGYAYLVTAIEMVYWNPEVIHEITKVLYPDIASKHNTTASHVERAIRHAVEVGMDAGSSADEFNEVFGNSIQFNRGKPTNAHFIAGVVDYLHMKE